jgi:transposase
MKTLVIKNTIQYEEKVNELKKALKATKNIRMYKRYSVLLRHYEGFTNKRIAEMEDLELHAVGRYIKAYKSRGLIGLEMKYSTGAKRKLNKEQESKIVELITDNTPEDVGFESRKNWTIEIIRQLIFMICMIKIK